MSTVAPDRKIIDLLNEKKAAGVKTCVSLEYFPPRTDDGVKVSLHYYFRVVSLRVQVSLLGWLLGTPMSKKCRKMCFCVSTKKSQV